MPIELRRRCRNRLCADGGGRRTLHHHWSLIGPDALLKRDVPGEAIDLRALAEQED